MTLGNDRRSSRGTLDLYPLAKLGNVSIHSHTDSTPCSSSHKSATIEPLAAGIVAVRLLTFETRLCLYFALLLLFVGLQALHMRGLSFPVLVDSCYPILMIIVLV
jgi:hypothetical protein